VSQGDANGERRGSEFGFERTRCACRACSICCEHMPGALAPADLPRLAERLGYGSDIERFARENLHASQGTPVTTHGRKVVTLRTVIPAARENGACRFLDTAGRCTVHEASPFGCAYFDGHQSDREDALRTDAMYRAIYEDWQSSGPLSRVWTMLDGLGLRALPPDTRRYRLEKAMKREKLL
jgi:Fe-S-cluster containining protein